MFLEQPTFPEAIAYGARGGPQYSTSIVATLNHTEQRNQNWQHPLARYEVGLVHRDRALSEELLAFFRTIAQGRTNGFRLHDFLPGEADGTQEVLGVGNGTQMTFQLVKVYRLSADAYTVRTITKPVEGTVTVTVGGLATTPASVDHTRGRVTLASPPGDGQVVQASFQFDVPVRFDTDRLRLTRVAPDAYSWESVPLVETRSLT